MARDWAEEATIIRWSAILAAVLIAANLALGTLALLRYPAYWSQPTAGRFFIEPAAFLCAYAVALLILIDSRPNPGALRIASICGLLTGALEVLNVALENLAPSLWHGAAISITFMLLPFLLWTIAAAVGARRTGTWRNGLLAAVLSAALCMLLSVAAGFVLELFLAPPSAAAVAAWPEFLRSRWSDPRAFAMANTFDSAFTHLLFAPIVAAIFGSIASAVTLVAHRRSITNPQPS